MKNMKNLLFGIVVTSAVSFNALANNNETYAVNIEQELNSLLADNLADLQPVTPAKDATTVLANLEAQLNIEQVVADAVKTLPQHRFKVVIAD